MGVKGILGIFVVGGIAGVVAFGGFTAVLHHTNSEEFCVSCHEMTIPYEEFKDTTHYMNRTGNKVVCADCHVPKQFWPKLYAKIRASREVFAHLMGKLDTPEKYEEHRLEMARSVVAKMRATDSRECRNCHSFKKMELDDQGRRARRRHVRAMDEGKSCIECHMGIAHEMPDGLEDEFS